MSSINIEWQLDFETVFITFLKTLSTDRHSIIKNPTYKTHCSFQQPLYKHQIFILHLSKRSLVTLWNILIKWKKDHGRLINDFNQSEPSSEENSEQKKEVELDYNVYTSSKTQIHKLSSAVERVWKIQYTVILFLHLK